MSVTEPRTIEWKINGTNEWKYVGKAAKDDIKALTTALANVEEVDKDLSTGHLADVLASSQPSYTLDKALSDRCRALCGLVDGSLPVTFSTKVAPSKQGHGETHLEVLLPGKKSWMEIRSVEGLDLQHRNTVEILRVIDDLNSVPVADRPRCQFRFNVFFFNLQKPIKAPWSHWAQTLTHELTTHVEPRLNLIERWRANTPVCWEAIGDNDEFLFRVRGVPRYSLWLEHLNSLHASEPALMTRWEVAYKDIDIYTLIEGGDLSSHFKNIYKAEDVNVPDAQQKPLTTVNVRSLMNETAHAVWSSKKLVAISGTQPELVDQAASKDLIDALYNEFQTFLHPTTARHDSVAT